MNWMVSPFLNPWLIPGSSGGSTSTSTDNTGNEDTVNGGSLDTYNQQETLSDSTYQYFLDMISNYAKEQREFNQASVDKELEYNSMEAAKNRAFQEYMSNTAYQRAFADLKAAGINPLLAFQTLQAASTPSGSTATGSHASSSLSNASSVLGSLVSDTNANQAQITKFIQSLIKLFGMIIPYIV